MTRVTCEEALRLARALSSGKDRTDCENCGDALLDGQLAVCDQCLRSGPVRLTEFVKSLLSPTTATAFEELSCREGADRYSDWPPHLKRLIAATLLRAADEAERSGR